MRRWLTSLLLIAGTAAGATTGTAPECVVPAKPGGGFELTCRLAQAMLDEGPALRLSYLPGGIGAVAFNAFAGPRAAEEQALVAFSAGSLLNLAQGRFGRHSERDVRWLAAIGTDYGVIAVARDSPLRNLADVVQALRTRPNALVFGAGGTIGSQDWVKAALVARAAGVSHKIIRFVAFEGGGDALAALEGGHVQIFAGDAAELSQHLRRSQGVRVIAVLSERRLPGLLAQVPTAREQGFDIQWATLRGLYLGARVSEAGYRHWLAALERARQRPGFAARQAELGLYPLWLSGPELERHIERSMTEYRRLATEFQLGTR
ncbi:tripartite tricarboxylate transporter substrate binding protein [Roseateles sp. DAIF2]|uniref:tripartite tricarboxylate transporter substrate binding protein n=1 Tax=Roseateles sp. DAIF2 TaxID=2714952 RepID=UPI0018A327C6|nr:tripartite tricarboxylate transporter substrate-binding protein [Roseateles sp. DAIF2]QPF75733.1 tripartite tricarboxylate transporter substrate binding protein [Roseateles sp. DAIF2]